MISELTSAQATLFAAAIAAVVSLIGSILNNRTQNKKFLAEFQKQAQDINHLRRNQARHYGTSHGKSIFISVLN